MDDLRVPNGDFYLVCPGPLCDRLINLDLDWIRIAFSKEIGPALSVFWNTLVRRCIEEEFGTPASGARLLENLDGIEANMQEVREGLDQMATKGVEVQEGRGVEIAFRLNHRGEFETQVAGLRLIATRGEDLYIVRRERLQVFFSEYRGASDQPFRLGMSHVTELDGTTGICRVERTWEGAAGDVAPDDDAISEIVATCVKASRREGNSLRVIREAERRVGVSFPEALTEYYRVCDGFDFPDGYTRFISLEKASSMGVSMQLASQSGPWAYMPVFDDCAEAPICVLCASPLRGMLARVPSEGVPTLIGPSLGHFLKATAKEDRLEEVYTEVDGGEAFTLGGAQASEIYAGLQTIIANTDDDKVRAAAVSFGHSLGVGVTQ